MVVVQTDLVLYKEGEARCLQYGDANVEYEVDKVHDGRCRRTSCPMEGPTHGPWEKLLGLAATKLHSIHIGPER
jgi:hypothetical protein